MTTTTPVAAVKRLAILRHLAGGKSLDVTATIVGLDRDAVLDVASHHGYPDTDKLAWAADILAKKITDADTATIPTATPEPRRPAPARPVAVAPQPAPATQAGDTINALVHQAKEHPSKRIQAAANKVLDDVNRLRQLIVEDEQKHAAKRRADAEKEKARAEVERLEAQLAAAKAKLRKPRAKKAAGAKPAQVKTERGPLDYLCRNDGCDKAYDTPQGRSMHERMKCQHREQEAS